MPRSNPPQLSSKPAAPPAAPAAAPAAAPDTGESVCVCDHMSQTQMKPRLDIRYAVYERMCVCVSVLSAPRSVAEALQQRMDKYREAAESAKSKGDDRKARMHQRIVKVTHAKSHICLKKIYLFNNFCVCVLHFSNIKMPLKLIKQDGL